MNRFLIIIICIGLLGFTACKDKSEMPEKTRNRENKNVNPVKKTSFEEEAKKAKSRMSGDIHSEISMAPPTKDEVGDPDEVAVIETAKGDIVVEFFPDLAPVHVANFKKLAREEFYDGTTFHRVIPSFVIQGGDPNSKDDNPHNDGTGGPPWNLPAEFNDYKHDLGVLSMARSRDPNSAGSQFFICLSRERTKQLDKQYTVFGKVIKGIEAVEKIGNIPRDPRRDAEKPAVVMRRVRIEKRSKLGL